MIYTAIDTFYLTDEQIQNSPSRKHGINEMTEFTLRLYGCELIQESGILLKLPQAAMATGQVLFHRFYCKKSFTRFNVKRVAASCIWLASKLEESPRKLQHVLNVFHRMECRRENKPIQSLDPFSKKYAETRMVVLRTERHILKEMGFVCHVEHPHKFIINYLTQLEAPLEMMQEAWNLANDSLRTTLCVRLKSEAVACGVVYAAGRRFGRPLPENPPWWKVFGAEKHQIEEVCKVLANLHRQPKAVYIEVGKDIKPSVLSSRAWDPASDAQLNTSKVAGSNGASQAEMDTLKDSAAELGGDKIHIPSSKETNAKSEETQIVIANGESGDSLSVLKAKRFSGTLDGIISKSREKDKDRSKVRGKDRDRDHDGYYDNDGERNKDNEREKEFNCGKEDYFHDRERHREKERDKETERERDEKDYRKSALDKTKRYRDRIKDRIRDREDYDNPKDTAYRSKERSHLEKGRHHSSSRDKDIQGKERHRHHPYM